MKTKFAAVSNPLSLAASDDVTIVRVKAGTDTPAELVEVGVSFDGVTTSDTPFRVQVLKQSTDGTATSLTPAKMTGTASPTVKASAAHIFTAEPTHTDILWDGYVSPVGKQVIQIPDELTDIAAGERIALRLIVPAGITTVNGIGYIHWLE